MRYIIFRPGYFGDTLVTFPLIISLQRGFPQSEIAFITNEHSSNLVRGGEVLDLLERKLSVFRYRRDLPILDSIRDLKTVMKPQPDDLLLYLPMSGIAKWRVVRDWLFFRILGFKKIVGIRHYLSSALVDGEREYQRQFRILKEGGVALDVPETLREGLIRGEEPPAVRLPEGIKIAVVCPGSKMQSKRWPLERFVDVMKTAQSREPLHFVLIGAAEEAPLGEEISRQVDQCSAAFGLPFPELIYILRRSELYIGNDTGPMHLAALLGVRCVSIFSSRARPGLWFPFGEGHSIFRPKIICEECNRMVCYADPPPCLLKTEVKDVADSVAYQLRSRG